MSYTNEDWTEKIFRLINKIGEIHLQFMSFNLDNNILTVYMCLRLHVKNDCFRFSLINNNPKSNKGNKGFSYKRV